MTKTLKAVNWNDPSCKFYDEIYKKQTQQFWLPEEIPVSDDDFTKMMLQNIEETDTYTKRDGEGFLTWGIKALDEATNGIPTEGITLVSAGPNVGKSALLLTLAWNVAKLNQTIDTNTE